jgi:hypothetical protein
MSSPLTFGVAKTRFAGLVTTKITVATAIQEALDRIFEMGRYANTTREIALASDDFIYDSTLEDTFIYFPRSLYSCAVAFRNDKRGWNIVNQAVLYREFANAGDYKFVNMGEVDTYDDAIIVISGSLTDGSNSVVFPLMRYAGIYNGKPFYTPSGEDEGFVILLWTGTDWTLNFDGGANLWSSSENVATPDLVTAWVSGGDATGTPVLNAVNVPQQLRYRCPQEGWLLDDGPFWAMMKLNAPTLSDDSDIIPITTSGAFKHAVQAVSYEYLSDENAADACWMRFERAMAGDEPISDGPVNEVGTPCGF